LDLVYEIVYDLSNKNIMQRIKYYRYIVLVIGLLLLLLIAPSCATADAAKVESQRKGLMIQDKADYSRNKKHFKKSKSYKKQKRRIKKYRR
jgi:hypothetical protein